MSIAACLMHKDENQYLNEWVNYHRSIGINHFYIYDNDSKIHPTITFGGIPNGITIIDWPGDEDSRMMRAYHHLYYDIKPPYDWIAYIDTDEFIIPSYPGALADKLSEVEGEWGDALALYWVNYGHSGYGTPAPSAFDYDRHADLDDPENQFFKSIVKTGCSPVFLNAHHFGVLTLDENMKGVSDYLDGAHTSESIYLRHNLIRSKFEFAAKIARGCGNRKNYTRFDMSMWDDLEKRMNNSNIRS